jgi:hypothetical protein
MWRRSRWSALDNPPVPMKLGRHYTILREDANAFLNRKREELQNERKVRYPEASR